MSCRVMQMPFAVCQWWKHSVGRSGVTNGGVTLYFFLNKVATFLVSRHSHPVSAF